MKFFKQILALILILSAVICGQRNSDELNISSDFVDIRNFDANNISLSRITNRGDFNTATWSSLNYGTINARRILFDAGIWVTGLIDSKIHAGIKYYSANYSPGPIINGQPALEAAPGDSLRYRVYKIFRGNEPTNPDLLEWPVDFGAPIDSNGNPRFYADQLLWTVYNMMDTSNVDTNYITDKKYGILPIEVQQKIYGYQGNNKDVENLLNNVVFIEWTIVNKGTDYIDSAFVGLWCDIDFYDINSNIPAVDVNRQTGYLWSGIERSPFLGGVPPAVGFSILYGPIKSRPDTTAVFKGKEIDGYYNLPLKSFHAIGDDSIIDPLYGPPRTQKQVYNIANGFASSGGIIIDTSISKATTFPFNGDPVSGEGWLFPEDKVGNGSGFVLFSGAFDLAPSDTQWVMAALVPGSSSLDKKVSILNMREKIDVLRQQPYDSLAFGKDSLVITGIKNKNEELPQSFALYQNYPNPFNPSTNIEFEVPPSSAGKVKLSIYNVLGQELEILLDKQLTPGKHSVTFDASDLPSGVYIYSLKSGSQVLNRKMLLLK